MFVSQMCTFIEALILQTVMQECGSHTINLITSGMDE